MSEALIILGALFQAAGFVLGVLQLRSGHRRVDEYETRTQTIEAGAALEAEVVFPQATVSASEPPLDERVESLERAFATERRERVTADRELRKSVDGHMRESRASTERLLQRELEALARAAVRRPAWQEWLAIMFFVIGLAMVTIGALT